MLHFKPLYVVKPWGGRRLESRFGRSLPGEPVGEAWELVELDAFESTSDEGSLGELWRAGRLGGRATGPFPFLLKWLDTTDWLSVQVHPNEEACAQMAHGRPKHEAWFVAQAEPDAALLVGHRPGLDSKTLESAAQAGCIADWLLTVRPEPGSMVPIVAGTLHAIGPGYLLLEVQQPSDTTYRVYDWQRPDLDGSLRPLHLQEAMQSVTYNCAGAPELQRQEVLGPCFHLARWQVGESLAASRLRVLVAINSTVVRCGNGVELELGPGDVRVCERTDGTVTLQSGYCVWVSES